MFASKQLHKWLLGCVLVFTFTGSVNPHTYNAKTSVSQTELVVTQQTKKKFSDYWLSSTRPVLTKKTVDYKLLCNHFESVLRCSVNAHIVNYRKSFKDYTLNYSQLLTRIYCIDFMA